MKHTTEQLIYIFTALGKRLETFGTQQPSLHIAECAAKENPWFTPHNITLSIEAIRTMMLNEVKLTEWLAAYPCIGGHKPMNVGVITAGNIPLVGFFDLLCVVISGNNCFLKSSSKDAVLMEYICDTLRDIEPEIPIYRYENQPLDAIIATGSENTNRYFRRRFGSITSLLRSSRSSLAVLTGSETNSDLSLLANDIFSYNSLGCRNVSMIFLPEGYDTSQLCRILAVDAPAINQKYCNNYLQHKALLDMNGVGYIDGGFFVMRMGNELPSVISEITYCHYNRLEDVEQWITEHSSHIQCVVGSCMSSAVAFGQSQYPLLKDYPDGRDVIEFLNTLCKVK